MTASDTNDSTQPNRPTFVGSAVWLFIGLAVAAPFVSMWKYQSHGWVGLFAVAVASAICLASASLALWVTFRSVGTESAGTGLLLSILIRTGIPLLAAAVLTNTVGWLASAGIFGLIVIFYLVSLALETALSVRMINSTRQIAKT